MTLKPRQLQELARMLTRRRESLEAETHADAAKSREDVFSATTGPVADTGDEAAADLIADVENAELSRDLEELREIDAALERLRAGRYGACAGCGGEIDPERLRREPAARRCIDCQRVHEKTFPQPGKPTL
jgi:RNA polymerase-binding transcription factor